MLTANALFSLHLTKKQTLNPKKYKLSEQVHEI